MPTLDIAATAASIGGLQDVIALDGKFYGRGRDDNVYRSDDDGVSWTRINATDAFFPYRLQYFDGFPYVLEVGTSELFRDDATSFGADPEASYVSTEAGPFNLSTSEARAFDGTKLVWFNRLGGDYTHTLDAASWTSVPGDLPDCAWAGLAWSGVEFCGLAGGNLIGGGPGYSATDVVVASPDGSPGSWVTGAMPASAFWSQLARGTTQFCAIADDDGQAAVAASAGTWSALPMPAAAAGVSWGALVAIGDIFVAFPSYETGSSLFALEAGAWTEHPASGVLLDALSVARIGNTIIAAGEADTLRVVVAATPAPAAPFWTGFVNCEEVL